MFYLQSSEKTDRMFIGGIRKPSKGQSNVITTDEWEIPPSQVIVESTLGEGAFGEVYRGTLRGPLSNPKIPTVVKGAICIPVAIKMLKCQFYTYWVSYFVVIKTEDYKEMLFFFLSASAKGSERRDFLQEIEMMKKVSEGQNPHVVAMVGCVTVQEPLSLITEFVPYGNLLSYLRTNRQMVHVV